MIITLEVADSDGMLFKGLDGCIRDLADLRGTYRIIPQTETAIKLMLNAVNTLAVREVTIYLDAPVSNSGNLKHFIYGFSSTVPLNIELVKNPDAILKELPYVVSGDSIILDNCKSWFNMADYILKTNNLNLTRLIDLSTT